MRNNLSKFTKVFTSTALFSLILISNNSELAANYLPNKVEQTITTLEISNNNNDLSQLFGTKEQKNFLRIMIDAI